MPRKVVAIVLIACLAIGLPAAYLLFSSFANQQNRGKTAPTTPSTVNPTSNPTATQLTTPNPTASDGKIFCSVDKYQSSNSWVGNSPVIAYYYPDGDYQPSYLPPPQTAYLYLRVTNNNSMPLYNAIAEVRYQSSGGSWKTMQSELGTIEPLGLKIVNMTLMNPAVIVSNSTMINMHDANHRSVNIINYVLGPHEIDAYGFASQP
jgi:hypothetical protein